MIRHALALAAHGFPVFACAPGTKVPAMPKAEGGRGCLDATVDQERIEAWWRRWPDANIAIATGKTHWVLDIDGEAGAQTLTTLEDRHGALPSTIRIVTPSGGEHYWFRPVAGLRNSARRIGPGIDTRGDGGYVVVPPSVVNGRRYTVSVDAGPAIAAAPDWLIGLARHPAPQAARRNEWSDAAGFIPEGQRNHTLTHLAGMLLRRYVDADVVLALMQSHNQARCKPPLADRDVTRIVNSIAGRELRRRQAAGG